MKCQKTQLSLCDWKHPSVAVQRPINGKPPISDDHRPIMVESPASPFYAGLAPIFNGKPTFDGRQQRVMQNFRRF